MGIKYEVQLNRTDVVAELPCLTYLVLVVEFTILIYDMCPSRRNAKSSQQYAHYMSRSTIL